MQTRILSKFTSEGTLEAVPSASLYFCKGSTATCLQPPLLGCDRALEKQSTAPSGPGWLAGVWAARISMTVCEVVVSPWPSIPQNQGASDGLLRARGVGREWEGLEFS